MATITFANSTISVQLLGGFIPAFELNYWRFLALFLFGFPILIYQKCRIDIKTKYEFVGLVVVGIMLTVSNYAFYEAAVHLPVGTLQGVGAGGTLIVFAIWAIVYTRTYDTTDIIATIICVIGITTVTQPDFIFEQHQKNSTSHEFEPKCTLEYTNNTSVYTDAGEVISLTDGVRYQELSDYSPDINAAKGYILLSIYIVSFCSAMILINTVLKEMNPIAVSVWNGILGALINGILMMFVENPVIPTTSQCICYFLLHILGLALGGTLLVVGYQVVAPFVGTLILSLEVVLLVVAQYTILSHVNPGHRNVWEIFGVLVILLANIMRPIKSLVNEYRNRKG